MSFGVIYEPLDFGLFLLHPLGIARKYLECIKVIFRKYEINFELRHFQSLSLANIIVDHFGKLLLKLFDQLIELVVIAELILGVEPLNHDVVLFLVEFAHF
jgi:hypothetical protein